MDCFSSEHRTSVSATTSASRRWVAIRWRSSRYTEHRRERPMAAEGSNVVQAEADLLPALDRRGDGAMSQYVTPHAHADSSPRGRRRYAAPSACTAVLGVTARPGDEQRALANGAAVREIPTQRLNDRTAAARA